MIVAFLKFGKAEYIEDCCNSDYLYFDCLKNFRSNNRDSSFIFDPREGNIHQDQMNYLKLKIKDKTYRLNELKDFNAQYQEFPNVIPGNICSLYSLKFEEQETERAYIIDERMFRINGKVLVIYNTPKFYKDLDSAINKMNLGYTRKEVVYYDRKTYNGELTFHHKDSSFSFQNEYRILIKSDGKSIIRLKLPSMKEYSKVITNDESKMIKVART